jgi:hypothetical protein
VPDQSGSRGFAAAIPVVTACSYNLFHVPFFTVQHGTTPASERSANPDSDFLKAMPQHLRTFAQACSYAPNQAYIGGMDPRCMPPRPWHNAAPGTAAASAGPPSVHPCTRRPSPSVATAALGAIVDERMFYALVKLADSFDLVSLTAEFAAEAKGLLEADNATAGAELGRLSGGSHAVDEEIAAGALPLVTAGRTVGCIKSAHPTDVNLAAHTMLENLASKATAVYALRRLLADSGIDPRSVDYVIECSEEACGDMNQRGGGNFAKAIAELCGLVNATGSDVRSFCAGPVHGLMQAASLIRAGTMHTVVLVAGGTTAKLAMNAKKHIEKGLPVLEDCMGSFALILEADAASGLLVRTDVVGTLKVGSGSSPQAVMQDLVAAPLARAGLRFADIDLYAPELQNPEITEAAGAGNVTLANMKMIAAMAVMKKEIEKPAMDPFIQAHGLPGWAPTQGHIPSGIPAIGWFLSWARAGTFTRGLVIGKGSLFLGRMTGLFDGVSILLEARDRRPKAESSRTESVKRAAAPHAGRVRIGLTLPGSEAGETELVKGAEEAAGLDSMLEPVFFGKGSADARAAHRDMKSALASRDISAAVTFHYPFPIGIATVGHMKAPANGKDLFIATTTGTASTGRVEALVLNAVSGIAVAKAFGISSPRVGILNLDGAARAHALLRALEEKGYRAGLVSSSRGDPLLRGNDILSGSVDVLVCDSLTGNAVVKLLGAYATGGKAESTGSGYGPGVGDAAPAIGIISRATAAPVVSNALAFMARMIRGNLAALYKEEKEAAIKAGLSSVLAGAPAVEQPAAREMAPVLAKKVVQHEIEGIDVLSIDDARTLLLAKGIYCEAAMGCTGPVILVAEEDAAKAVGLLKGAGMKEGGQ